MKNILALFLSLSVVGFSAPAAFKGIPFGTGCASFFQQYKPGGSWAQSRLAADISFSESDQALVAIPPQVSGIIMGKVFTEWLKDSVAGVDADTRFIFSIQSPADAAKLKLAIDRGTANKALLQEVQATFESRDAEKVLASLIEKYGQPARTETKSVMQKSTGVLSDVNMQVWEIPDAVVEFCKIAPPKGNPLLTMRSTVVKSQAAKAGASNL